MIDTGHLLGPGIYSNWSVTLGIMQFQAFRVKQATQQIYRWHVSSLTSCVCAKICARLHWLIWMAGHSNKGVARHPGRQCYSMLARADAVMPLCFWPIKEGLYLYKVLGGACFEPWDTASSTSQDKAYVCIGHTIRQDTPASSCIE